MTELELLRLHVNAGWNLRLLSLSYGDVEMPGDEMPPWVLYLGAIPGGHVRIWRRDVVDTERAGMVERALAVLAQSADAPTPEDISREVALGRAEAPKIDVAQASHLARRLTADDAMLLEAFEQDSAPYFLAPARAPLFGVVEGDRLLSVAHSSRRTAQACELGVNTVPDARSRGYGLAVVVRWADAVAAEGIEPLYSARASNEASLALARAAGYRPFAQSVYIMPTHPPARGEIAPRR